MITLDQIQMLERKVESAVAKIAALQELNAVLRDKNTELEHANGMLSQRISSFEADQGRIEQGILNALDRLNSMESAVLKSSSSALATQTNNTQPTHAPEQIVQETEVEEIHSEPQTNETEQYSEQTEINDPSDEIALDFDTEASESSSKNQQFDIF